MSARAPDRWVSAAVMERDPRSVWLAVDEDGYDGSEIACPVCGLLIGVGGMKGWLIRRLRTHYTKCRPKHRVYRHRDAVRLEKTACIRG